VRRLGSPRPPQNNGQGIGLLRHKPLFPRDSALQRQSPLRGENAAQDARFLAQHAHSESFAPLSAGFSSYCSWRRDNVPDCDETGFEDRWYRYHHMGPSLALDTQGYAANPAFSAPLRDLGRRELWHLQWLMKMTRELARLPTRWLVGLASRQARRTVSLLFGFEMRVEAPEI
jgi:hypothetical protein